MTNQEKCTLLKDTIYQLYVNEGRSKVYIGKLLGIDRASLGRQITRWGFVQKNQFRGVKPSVQKYINNSREKVKHLLQKDMSMGDIANELNIDRHYLRRQVIMKDKILTQEYDLYNKRKELRREEKINKKMKKYEYDEIEGEVWKQIMGYPLYEISNKGRVRSKQDGLYRLLHLYPNKNSGYLYTNIHGNKGRRMLSVARLVGFAFLSDYYSNEKNTINHKDGDKNNNYVENLEWVSQAENNQHAQSLPRKKQENPIKFEKIIYMNMYEFKTLTAYAKFVNISPTQARRRIDNPEKWHLEIVTTKR